MLSSEKRRNVCHWERPHSGLSGLVELTWNNPLSISWWETSWSLESMVHNVRSIWIWIPLHCRLSMWLQIWFPHLKNTETKVNWWGWGELNSCKKLCIIMTMEEVSDSWENYTFFTLSLSSKIYSKKNWTQFFTIFSWIPHPVLFSVVHECQEPQWRYWWDHTVALKGQGWASNQSLQVQTLESEGYAKKQHEGKTE